MKQEQTMYKGIFDTHAHYDEACFAENLVQVIEKQKKNGVSCILNCSSTVPSSYASAKLAERFECIYAAVGILLGFDPAAVGRLPADWEQQIEQLALQPKVVCIGEIGLDYFDGKTSPKSQRDVFCRQLELAARQGLPVELHSREADADMLAILREYRPAGVLHRFSGGMKTAEELLSLGLYLGIGPELSYPVNEGLPQVVREMPLAQMVLETDAPFLPPAHLAGQIAVSDMLKETAEEIGKLRKEDPQEIIDRTRDNGLRLFRIHL